MLGTELWELCKSDPFAISSAPSFSNPESAPAHAVLSQPLATTVLISLSARSFCGCGCCFPFPRMSETMPCCLCVSGFLSVCSFYERSSLLLLEPFNSSACHKQEVQNHSLSLSDRLSVPPQVPYLAHLDLSRTGRAPLFKHSRNSYFRLTVVIVPQPGPRSRQIHMCLIHRFHTPPNVPPLQYIHIQTLLSHPVPSPLVGFTL